MKQNITESWGSLFLFNKSEKLIANVKTNFFMLKYGQCSFPATMNDGQFDNSYVVSPYTAFILYAKEELVKIKNKFIQVSLSFFLTCFSSICKLGKINHLTFVNNYLLSTNLYPSWDGENICKITKKLTTRNKNSLIAFRSLNEYQHEDLIKSFLKNGYYLMASRQVYIFDHHQAPYQHKKNVIIDKKLLSKKDYTLCNASEIKESDFERIVELYNLLYLDKYSYHNPQFTTHFIKSCHQKRLLDIYGLRNQEGILDGVIGFFTIENTTTAPLVGYDTSLPAQLGLYRRLIALTLNYAQENNYLLNLSSGAPKFKRLRGGIPKIEYTAIYFQHLPFFRRIFWHALLLFANKICKPLLTKYEL